ncbi:MAG: coproporphyrinogen III oxidase family protein, partial [Acidobacteriaceae bacterium]
VDEDSRLGREVIAGGVRFHAHGVPSDEISAELYEQACGFLEAHGFPQYEISNFAMGEHQSRHNRKYWERAPYFGFGLDAHSMLPADGGAVRFANPDEMRDYGAAAWGGKVVRMGMDEAFEESLFLGLRMNDGVPVVELETQFGHERVDGCGEAVRELVEGGLMDSSDGRWRLTLRGRMVSNEVFGRLLEGVVA